MKSFKEDLDEIFNRFMRKMEEALDRKEQSNVKVVDKTFNEINQQSELEASQDEDLEIKSQSNFQSLQEKHGKEHESDGIDVLDIKLNNTTNSISPSSFHVNKDENVPTGVTKKALAQCSQPLLPDKSADLIYGVESWGSSKYLLKQNERIYDGSTNTSVDSYANMVLLPTIAYIPNNVEYSRPIVVEPDDTIFIASKCLGISKSGIEDRQFFINGIQKTTWKTNKYKLYCFKNSPLKQKGLQHKF